MCSGITLSRAQRTTYDVRAQTQFDCIQDKHLTCCVIPVSPAPSLFYTVCFWREYWLYITVLRVYSWLCTQESLLVEPGQLCSVRDLIQVRHVKSKSLMGSKSLWLQLFYWHFFNASYHLNCVGYKENIFKTQENLLCKRPLSLEASNACYTKLSHFSVTSEHRLYIPGTRILIIKFLQ